MRNNIILCIILFIAILISLVNNPIIEQFESNANMFDNDIRNGTKLVWFYAPWCGHCKTMHSEWDSASKTVNVKDNHMIKLNIGDKDNQKHQEIAQKYKIQGFPTILLLKNGKKKEEYSGNRKKNDFVNYCKLKGLTI